VLLYQKFIALKNYWIISLVALVFMAQGAIAQQRGQIITQATPATNPMNPDGDIWVSKNILGNPGTFPAGGDYWVDYFENKMFGFPIIGIGDVAQDQLNGPNCGITDLIPDKFGYSVYGAFKGSFLYGGATNDYAAFRFRLGKNASSVQSWSVLIDVDGLIGIGKDPNANDKNPGFELEITLIDKQSPGVFINYIDGITSCPSNAFKFYPLSTNHQVAVGDTDACGDADYFYDFFVAVPDLIAAFNKKGIPTALDRVDKISSAKGFRYVAATSTSATCFLSGTTSDVGGIDGNNPLYNKDIIKQLVTVIENQCPTSLESLCSSCLGFNTGFGFKPTIDTPSVGDTKISGTTEPGTYVKYSVYTALNATEPFTYSATPRETGIQLFNTAVWTFTLTQGPLLNNDKIVVRTLVSADGSSPCDKDGIDTTTETKIVSNNRPTASDATFTIDEDTQLTDAQLTASDADNDPLTYSIVTGLSPAIGSLSLTNSSTGKFSYTPPANYFGTVTFTFRVYDGKAFSDTKTITIIVTSVNDAPVAVNDNATTNEDTPVTFSIVSNDTDIDGTIAPATVDLDPSTPGEDKTRVTAQGTYTVSNTGSVTFTPVLNFNGVSSITYTVKDNNGALSNAATITVTVNAVNDPPVAADQSVTVIEDTPKVITLVGTDVEGSTLVYTVVTQPTRGTLSGSGSTVTYTPELNYNGADSFTFKVNDGSVDSNIATVTITVTPVNDPPVAGNQSLTTPEDTALPITLTATDVDNVSLTYTIATPPQHGTLSVISGAGVTYTPALNYVGPDSFVFTASDGSLSSNGTILIQVTPVNDAPVALPQSLTTPEDTSLPITLTGTDVDGDALTYAVVTLPAHGSLSCTNCQNPIYTPADDYFGPDSFTFRVNDGQLNSASATISINVTAVNDIPVAFNKTVLYQQNVAKAFTLDALDEDPLDVLTYTVITQPLASEGTISGTAPNLTFTPFTNYVGTTTLTFRVNDGSVNSNVATVTFRLDDGTNYSPIAEDQNLSVNEDTNLNINLLASDANGDALIYEIVSPPSHGTFSGISVNGRDRTYTPALNYNGPDSFTFRAFDGVTYSNVATVTITVIPVNDAPVANNQSVNVTEDVAQVITLTGSDIENSALTFTVVVQPTKGTLSCLNCATPTYTPNLNYNGPDSFTFKVNDGALDSSSPATVSITVLPVNDVPVAVNDNATTNEDNAVSFSVVANDTDIDGVINPATVDLDPATLTEDKSRTTPEGVFTVSNLGVVTFTPVLNFNGTSTITYTVKDNEGGLSNAAVITVTILQVNDAPAVTPKTVTTAEDTPVSVCFTVTDLEGDESIFKGLVSLDNHGTPEFDLASGAFCFLYTPNPDFNGTDRVQVTVCDKNDITLCSSGTITINVQPDNDAPRVIENGISTDIIKRTTAEDTPLNFCFDVVDPDGDDFTVSAITNVSGGGTLVLGSGGLNEACMIFTPALNFNGKSIWTINICDDATPSLCGTFTIEIDVTAINDAPVANAQSVTLPEETAKEITLTGSDIDGDALTFTVVTLPLHGTLTGTAPNLTYTPDDDFDGTDSFTFKVNDGQLDSDVAVVSITVTPINDPPIIIPLPTFTTPEDTPIDICISTTDPDGDILTFSNPVNLTGGGTMVLDATNGICFTFTPAKDFNGVATWKFKTCDDATPSLCSETTVTITVTPVNDPPVAVDDFMVVKSAINSEPINLLKNDFDVDGDQISLGLVALAGPFHGTILTMNSDGTFVYVSNQGFVGSDSVRYKVCDNANPSLCDEGVVFIQVEYPPLKVYNAVSPNGDGLNDYWRIDGIEAYPNNQVNVFDRYNNLIFVMNGYDNDQNSWSGQINHSMIRGSAKEGTYYYTLNLGDGSGLMSGYIVLKNDNN
jgi:gliding motility-associated-like protein